MKKKDIKSSNKIQSKDNVEKVTTTVTTPIESKSVEIPKKEKTLKEKLDDYKKKIIEEANAFAERRLNALIAKEEQREKFKEIDAKNKPIAEAKIKEKAQAKCEMRKAKRLAIHAASINKTIPSKVHPVVEPKVKVEKKKKVKKLPRKRQPVNLPRTTKEQRIAAIKAKKAAGKEGYNNELIRQAKEIEADRAGYAKRIKKRQETENQRLERLAERRRKRKNILITEEIKQLRRQAQDIKRFMESEKKRIARKAEKAAKYFKGMKNSSKEQKEKFIYRKIYADGDKFRVQVGAFMEAFNTDKYKKHINCLYTTGLKDHKDSFVGCIVYQGYGDGQKVVYKNLVDKFKDKSTYFATSSIADLEYGKAA